MRLQRYTPGRRSQGPERTRAAGFSLLELTMTLAVGIVLAALAIPAVRSGIQYFRVRSAVSSVTGAIQSTSTGRYSTAAPTA